MISFSKISGVVALSIVVLARTLGSASPVPDGDNGLPAAIQPTLVGGVDAGPAVAYVQS